MDYLARGGIIGRFQAQEFISTKDERRPIFPCLLEITETCEMF